MSASEESSAAMDTGSDSNDDLPLSVAYSSKTRTGSRGVSALEGSEMESGSEDELSLSELVRRKSKEKRKKSSTSIKSESEVGTPSSRRRRGSEAKTRWTTLEHNGVLFPPEYEPHGVKLLYDRKPVELTPSQEEAATFYAVMIDTDYVKKPIFVENFWRDFKELLEDDHVIQEFDKIDFSPIAEWHKREKERKNSLSKDEKRRIKEEREASEEKYKTAIVDGVPQKVGNFRVEPPGLFRGRGEHPKMGKIKKRIYPRDITINISPDVPIPEHPYPGQSWKEVRHDNTVTWLAFWKDPISPKDFKYVFLAANSNFKSESDMAKYEKARHLKAKIYEIRKNYREAWMSDDMKEKQMGTAMYFIDKLALRAGHEKDAEEADTVGCCNLKVENVECIEPKSIKFDFLGKDSIRYENRVEVDRIVFENVKTFCQKDSAGRNKAPGDQLFDLFDAQDLNNILKMQMDGLSAKVFRTYNASITLQEELRRDLEDDLTVERKKSEYDEANKRVAILCNHQRAVPKTHDTQIEKLNDKLSKLDQEISELDRTIKDYRVSSSAEEKKLQTLKKRRERKVEQKEKVKLQISNKESLKSVALGTSKINYLDPRITVAWCKKNEVPIEKIFNNSLLEKFGWAMSAESTYEF